MRRSAVVTLTLLPMLASAAVASADGPPAPSAAAMPLDQPDDQVFDQLVPPGTVQQVLMPPGMTPPLHCETDPNWQDRDECIPGDAYYYSEDGTVIRGGFGQYFWIAPGATGVRHAGG